MTITLLYFARVREAIGRGSEAIELPADVATIADLIDHLAASSDAHAEAFSDRARLRAAMDQQFVPLDTAIAGARELALFPPVTGG